MGSESCTVKASLLSLVPVPAFTMDASITGSVSSDSHHKRQTDSTAAYEIHAKTVQQPPSEGMEKLNSLLAQAMEPIKKE